MKFTLFVALLGTYGVVVRARGANPNMRDFGNFGERTEVESDNEEQTCEHQTMEITCDGGIIEIVRASYGRSDWTTCAEGQPCHTIECDADSSMDILQEQCNGRESCSVDASNSVFGDPCFGTFKYLDVGWNCLERLGPPDNVYKKFMLVFLQNYVANRPAELFIAPAGDEPATFTVNAPYVDFTQTSTVQANNILMVQVPAGVKLQEGPITNRGIEIVSDVDIVVYGVNKEDYTTDGFLGLPEDVLGTSYVVASWPGTRSIPAEIGVVAVEDNTEVTIDPTSPVRFDGRYKGAASFTFTLNSRFDAAQVTGYWGDLTGTTVTSDKPVAVLSGHRCGNVPEGVGWCDHLVEMIPAKSTLGRTFVTMPIAGRTGGDIVRIIASEDGTDIDIVGRSSESLNEGRFVDIETSSTEYLSITANNPIMVVQYNKGQAADWVQTDPFMMLISPVEQYDSRYTFATVDSPTNTYTTYIGIVIKTSERDGIRLDGAAISPTWTEIPGSDFSAAAVQISAGTHNTRHTNPIAVFSLYLYGHTPYESFASIGGSRLYPYGDPCTETETSSGDGVDNDCDQRVDEELRNGVDDDGDGLIDEDLASEEGEVDECAENTHECDANADCINTHGSYNCECRPGYTGDGRTCEGAEGVCKCNGDTHCYTFDSRKHDYQGICEYILFETAGSGDLPALSVYISLENRNGRTHVSYVWKVSLLIYGVRIDVLLANKAVLWNGWQFNLGSTLPHGLSVRQSGQRVVIKTSFGLLVVVSGKSGVQLRVPGPYRAGTNGGICGNWNGDANDDNLKPDGSAAANTAEYGDSWVTTAPCGTTTSPVDPLNGCDVPRMEALCNLIRDAVGPFAGGHGALAPGGIFDDCVYDCCATDGSPDEVCEAAGFYVAFVQHLGSAILAWRTAEFCQPSCPTNSHYELCGTACPATCTDTGAPDTCAQHCVEGCVCDEGYVRSGRRCVSVFDCGCVHNGFYYNVGSTWFTENCNERCTCNGKNDLSCEAVSCHADAFCGVQEQIYGCHCNDGFIGDGIECRPPGRCPAGWTEYGLSCFQVVQTQVTCDEAGPSAAAMDARLAIIRDEEMHNFVANLMSAVSTSDTYYIGLSDRVLELAFYWSDGSYLRSYNRWGPGYPGGWDRNNNCVFYYYANGAWWWRVGGGSMYCLVERYFFCPEGWHQWGGSCYYAFSFSYSWDATWTFLNSAEGYYSSLAMINSQEENDYVYNMIGDGYRIGAYRRNGYWYWRWWYRWYRYYWWYYIYWFNWQNGDPNNGGDCAVFSPGGFWEDDDCSGGRPFCAEMDINECNSNPCGPNSRCINHPNGYTCECIPGCMGEGCRASGNCWVVTGSHYFQFDGSRVDFLGSCSYVLARYTGSSGQLTRFTVTSGNEYRDGAPDVPYLSWVSLAVGETTITLRRNGVAELNGRPRNTPFYVGRMMAVRRSGYFVSITTSFGLLVEYDGDRAVHIELSSGYGNAVEGMCGDFSGDSDGDLERPDGTDAGSATVFGDSWRSDGCPGGTPSVYPWDGCDTSGFVSGCSIISDTAGPFGPYLQALFAQTVYEACLLDQCVSSGDDDQRCSNIQTFAAMCSSVGWVAVDWAGPASCPRDCPANSQFVTCAPICQSTCADTEPQQCGRCRGACVCDEGFVLSGDSCVPKSDCGCTDGDGFYYPNNAVFTGTDCFTTGTCTNGELTYVDLSCHDYAYCDTNDEGVYGCHCEAGYIGDGVTSCTLDPGDCPDGFVPYAYSCFRVTPDTMTFDDCAALAAAATENGTGRMALISDQGTHDFVSTLVSSSSASWIGLDDRNVEALFTWSDGSYLGAFNLWGSGAPGDNGDCVSYPAGSSTWQDGDCTATAACIIEIRNPCPSSWVARKGWCYKYFKGGQSYEGARQKCIENYGSAMAAIRSSAENAFVFNRGHGWTSSDGEFSGYVNEEDEDAEGCPYQYRSSGGQQPQTEMACEHSELTLTCSNGYELVIQSANYGRTDGSTCPHSAMSDTNCVEPTSLDIVRDACRDRSTCTISASNSVFGDPCYGTYKYLTVGYFCRRQPGLWKREPCQRWLPYTCRLDVNECASGDNECDVNAVCTNTPGGYTCACKIGYTGDGISPEYGGQGCVRRGLCTVWGNAHVYTFDGAHYTYNGKCYYDMAVFDQRVDGLTRWRVEVRLKSRTNSLSSSVEEVFIYIANNVYKLLRDAPEYSRWPKCMRNRLFQHTPNYFDGNYDSRIRIYRRGGSFQLVTDFGLVVTYNRDHRLQIVIPEPYRNAGVMGLCGNFNGDSTDDQTGRDGTVSADVVTFADSWNSRPTIQYCTDPTPPTNPRDGCNTAPFEALCEVLRDTTGPLAAGHAYVDPQVAYQNCLYDLCAEGSDYVCSVYQAYVEDCAAFGASFGDWRTPTSCPYTCPENSHYSLSTSPCRATCAEPDAPASCGVPNAEGCECDDGYIWSGDVCVRNPADCGCLFDGTYLQLGEYRVIGECEIICHCSAPNTHTCEVHGCGENGFCRTSAGRTGCECLPGFVDNSERQDGTLCDWNVCERGWKYHGQSCYHIPKARRNNRKAEQHCKALHPRAILARVLDQETHEFLLTMIQQTGNPRLGFRIAGNEEIVPNIYRRSDYAPLVDFQFFVEGQPESAVFFKRCLAYAPASSANSGKVEAVGCNGAAAFICEIPQACPEQYEPLERVEGEPWFCHRINCTDDGDCDETAVDIDECAIGEHDCHPEAFCLNNNGSYTCVCMPGRVGNGTHCQQAGLCQISGDPNFVGLDGQSFSFQGDCKYTMVTYSAGARSFVVEVSFEHREHETSAYVNYVSVTFDGHKVEIFRGRQFIVDGIRRNIPAKPSRNTNLEISFFGNYVIVETRLGLRVIYDGWQLVQVTLPSTDYLGAVGGLCGNFNGDPDDDLEMPDGNQAATVNDFVNSWLTADQDPASCVPPDVDPLDGCDTDAAGTRCALLLDEDGPFANGFDTIDNLPFYEACVRDLCVYSDVPDDTVLCFEFAAYAAILSEAQVVLPPWRSETLCPLMCGENEHYDPQASPCTRTCAEPDPGHCIFPPRPRCVCNEGYLRSGLECVPVDQCGCWDAGFYYKLEEVFYEDNCRRCGCGKRPDGTPVIGCRATTCHPQATCTIKDGRQGCHCNDGLFGDGIDACASEPPRCDPGFHLVDGRCCRIVELGWTYSEAQGECRAINGRLVVVNTEILHTLVVALKNKLSPTSNYWIGYDDIETEGVFVGSDGLVLGSWNKWSGTSPHADGPDCVLYLSDQDHAFPNMWSDRDCESRHGYICERDVDECSNPDWNNCHANARCLNTFGSFECECNTGFIGDGVNQCSGSSTCRVFGSGPHFFSHDRLHTVYRGGCDIIVSRYTGSAFEQFEIVVSNKRGGEGNSRTYRVSSVKVVVYGITIQLFDDRVVWVNGIRVWAGCTPYLHEDIYIYSRATALVIRTSFMRIILDSRNKLDITLSDIYAGVIEGMCGDLDGDPTNDNLTPDGTAAAGDNELAMSWAVETITCSAADDPDPECESDDERTNAMRIAVALNQEEAGSPFQDCFAVVNPAKYFLVAITDLCNHDLELSYFCDVAAAYARACYRRGVQLPVWRVPTDCPLPCMANAHYESCTTACPATCRDRNSPNTCEVQQCVEGCVCDDGFVLGGNKCTLEADCGCTVDGFWYPLGYTWFKPGCTKKCTCTAYNDWTCEDYTCEGHMYECNIVDAVLGCHCKAGFVFNEDTQECEVPPCPDGWITYEGSCYNLFNVLRTWWEARAKCIQWGATLVTIKRPDEAMFINLLWKGWRRKFWVGLYDEDDGEVGNFRWVDGAEIQWRNWYRNEPEFTQTDADGNTQRCGVIMPDNRTSDGLLAWRTDFCVELKPYICERDLDVDECANGVAVCDKNAYCVNTPGSYRCICNNGFTWDETFQICQKYGRCHGNGDPHYHTFDGKTIDFMGVCTYTLSEVIEDSGVTPFIIKAKQGRRDGNTAVSFIDTLIIQIYSDEIIFQRRGGVYVNGPPVTVPLTLSSGVQIFRQGLHLTMSTPFGLQAGYDGKDNAFIVLPAPYMGKVRGICGNFNLNKLDDCTKADGTVATSHSELGDSFLVGQSDSCVTDVDDPRANCDMPLMTYLCSALTNTSGAFAPCHDIVDPQPFFENCVYDLCAYDGDTKWLCNTAKAYADACLDAGVAICDWRSHSFCRKKCTENAHYTGCGGGCPATCSDPSAPETCGIVAEGCVCDEGYYFSDNICVPLEQCGCTDSSGYHQVGTRWVVGACSQGCSCDTPNSPPTCVDWDGCADVGGVCRLQADGIPGCQCIPPYTGDGVTCNPPPCDEYWTLYNDNCYRYNTHRYDYNQAKQICSDWGGLLCMPKSQADQDFLMDLVRDTVDQTAYIGVTDIDTENVWMYEDGTQVGAFTYWTPDPEKYNTDRKDCTTLRKAHNYHWFSDKCYQTAAPCCQKPRN